jgi:hypothetical protein
LVRLGMRRCRAAGDRGAKGEGPEHGARGPSDRGASPSRIGRVSAEEGTGRAGFTRGKAPASLLPAGPAIFGRAGFPVPAPKGFACAAPAFFAATTRRRSVSVRVRAAPRSHFNPRPPLGQALPLVQAGERTPPPAKEEGAAGRCFDVPSLTRGVVRKGSSPAPSAKNNPVNTVSDMFVPD